MTKNWYARINETYFNTEEELVNYYAKTYDEAVKAGDPMVDDQQYSNESAVRVVKS